MTVTILLTVIMNINRPGFLKILRQSLYGSYHKYAAKVEQKRARGEWTETWGMVVNPENTDVGFAFTLVGCPIVEYAKILHAKLIRTHTVARGADSCDYWYVPDKSSTAKSYMGPIV